MARNYRTALSEAVDKKLYIKGWTRSELADHMGVSYQYLNNILVGRAVPSIQASERMAEALDEEPRRLRQAALRNKQQRDREKKQKKTA
jgi:transcriptional regulator with XRE-family HTH domain